MTSLSKSDNIQYNTLGLWVNGMIVSLTKCLIFQICIIFFFHNEIENKLIVFKKLSKNHIDTGHYPDQIFVAEKIIRMIELIFAIEIWI